MAAALLPDRLWDLVEPLLPILPRRPQGGRPRVSDRACLTGIVFVLRSGIPWQMLPQELGCGSGMTCWRRLRDWWMRFFHSRASGDSRGVVQIVWWETAAMMQRQSGPGCELAASCRCWRCAAPSTAAVWELGAGSSSGHLPGSISFDAFVSGTTSGPTFTKRSSR